MNKDCDNLSGSEIGIPTIQTSAETREQIEASSCTISADQSQELSTPVEEVKPTILTKAEHGKLMRQYWTVTHPRVVGCNHRLDLSRDPRHNCESCWFAYFANNEKLVEEADAIYIRDGQSALKDKYGRKFVPKFFGFMSTMANWKNTIDAAHAAEEANPTPEVSAAA